MSGIDVLKFGVDQSNKDLNVITRWTGSTQTLRLYHVTLILRLNLGIRWKAKATSLPWGQLPG